MTSWACPASLLECVIKWATHLLMLRLEATCNISTEKPLQRKYYFVKRVLMGLTDRRKTAKNLVDSRKNWKILTVSRK